MSYDGQSWNEGAPVNSNLAADLDDNIRDLKIGVRSRMANEHGWRDSQLSTGSDGYHKFVSLTTQTAQPGLVYGTATQAAAIYAISSGTGVSTVVRNSAGYEMTLGHSAYLGGGIVPKGVIVMWSGTIATIPFGWALCDGNNGTTNLVDKFIVGAKQDDSGAAKTNVSGSLTQSGGAATKTLDITEIPAHTHTVPQWGGNSGTQPASCADGAQTTDNTTSSVGGGTAFSLLNPYYALAFIMKL